MEALLGSELLRRWLIESFPPPPFKEQTVSIIGSGPIHENDLLELMYEGGLTVYVVHEDTDILIVGRDKWDERELDDLLEARAGQTLKVYSQEMFLAFWASGRDPFVSREVVEAFGEGHPALSFLTGCGFDWPGTFVNASGGRLVIESPEVGVLKHEGYSVGRKGTPAPQRRAILHRIFHSDLSVIHSQLYMQQWGSPRSNERLKKMADCLATFCKKQKVKGNVETASAYEADLAWLRENFYRGRFRFNWPSTYVRQINSDYRRTGQRTRV
jgi:hypothetical protein